MSEAKLYIWQYIPFGLTTQYHSGGGAAVIATSLEDAIDILDKTREGDTSREEFLEFLGTPSAILHLHTMPEQRVWIFQDAGCC